MAKGEYGGGEWGNFEYGGTTLTLAASTAETTSDAQEATAEPQSTTLTATEASTTSTAQSATAAPQSVSLPASVVGTTVTPQSATLLPQTATLAASAGSTASDAQSANLGYAQWIIAGNPFFHRISEAATWQTLSLAFRLTTDQLTSNARTLKDDEGKLNILVSDDGGFVAVDRAGGSNTFAVTPPIYRQPLRQTGDMHVAAYQETLADAGVEEWTLELELTHDDNREDTPSISETPASGEWGLTTRFGQIATSHVDAEFLGTGQDGIERFSLGMRLTFEQAHVWEAALNKQAGTRIIQRPDATNEVSDDTGGDMTLTIDSPTEDVISDGDYVVLTWTAERINSDWMQYSAEIAPA